MKNRFQSSPDKVISLHVNLTKETMRILELGVGIGEYVKVPKEFMKYFDSHVSDLLPHII
jgi:hypothetical protein